MSSYAIVQFAFAPVIGGLSDRYGRRPVLLASLFGFGIDYLFLAFAPSIGWLFVEKADTVTLAMAIYAMLQSGNAQPWSYLGSLAIIMSIPIVIIFIIAAVITPSGDPYSMMALAAPMTVFYLLSALIGWLVLRRRRANAVQA